MAIGTVFGASRLTQRRSQRSGIVRNQGSYLDQIIQIRDMRDRESLIRYVMCWKKKCLETQGRELSDKLNEGTMK